MKPEHVVIAAVAAWAVWTFARGGDPFRVATHNRDGLDAAEAERLRNLGIY